jgi:hypothetical protein
MCLLSTRSRLNRQREASVFPRQRMIPNENRHGSWPNGKLPCKVIIEHLPVIGARLLALKKMRSSQSIPLPTPCRKKLRSFHLNTRSLLQPSYTTLQQRSKMLSSPIPVIYGIDADRLIVVTGRE